MMTPDQRLRRLAEDILASFWFSRRQAFGDGQRDETSCSMCNGHGYYYDYSVEWHTALCPVRWACDQLGTTDPLGKGNAIRDNRDAIEVGL